MAEKLSSPRLVQLPVLPPPSPKKKLTSPPPKALPVIPVPEPSNKLSSPPPKALPAPVPVPLKKLISPNPLRPLPVARAPRKRLSVPTVKAQEPFPTTSKARVPTQGHHVGRITDISNTPWRDELLPARFGEALFHVESGSVESGRRIVVHEFPKRDIPWSEDMGRSAMTFTIRGYCIQYVRDLDPPTPLYSRDYRTPRNILKAKLEFGGADTLQLPTMLPVVCVCQRYRMTEEEKFGGYVVFDMQFVELGKPPFRPIEDTEQAMLERSKQLKQQVLERLKLPHTPASSLPRPVQPARPPITLPRLTFRRGDE